MKPGDKVIVIANDEQLSSINMKSKKINDKLRKYESTISEELISGKFKDEQGIEHSSFVLDSTFVIPGQYLKLMNEQNDMVIEKPKSNVVLRANKNFNVTKQNEAIEEENEEEIEELEEVQESENENIDDNENQNNNE